MRKKKAPKRSILPDPRFNDPLVTRFVNELMKEGKKSLAYAIFYGAIDRVHEKTQEDGMIVWKKALDNVVPVVEIRARRIGGGIFQVPREVQPGRKIALGIKWLVIFAKKRGEKTMQEKLANEIIAAFHEEGGAFKRKLDTHKIASSNKAFSHFNI